MIETKEKINQKFPAVVANVINDYKVVINRGSEHDIRLGQRFLIYNLSDEEIVDPLTKEPLGYLEIVKGTGKVIHLQEKMATIESDKTEMTRTTVTKKRSPYIPPPLGDPIEEISSPKRVPFDSVKIGDKAKPI